MSYSPEDDREIAGEDIMLLGGDFEENANGDLVTVSGVGCAKQSAIRETVANPGSFPRRPEWGAGVSGLLFKANTPNVRSRIVSRTIGRLNANPRITKVHEVRAELTDEGNLSITMRCDAVGGRLETTSVVKPPGV